MSSLFPFSCSNSFQISRAVLPVLATRGNRTGWSSICHRKQNKNVDIFTIPSLIDAYGMTVFLERLDEVEFSFRQNAGENSEVLRLTDVGIGLGDTLRRPGRPREQRWPRLPAHRQSP